MKIAITGGKGFLGSYLTKYFSPIANVTSVGRAELDLLDENKVNDFFKDNFYDFVVNCAIDGRNVPTLVDNNILSNNIGSFLNIWNNRKLYGTLLNIGSGAEYGLNRSLNNVTEEEFLNHYPIHSYGLSKNIISRLIRYSDSNDAYTLRIFGCFDVSESNNRLLKIVQNNLENNKPFILNEDRYFDLIWVKDIAEYIKQLIFNPNDVYDINCVYDKKMLLSEIIKNFISTLELDQSLFTVTGTNPLNYTGSGEKFMRNSNVVHGLTKGFECYRNNR